MRGKWFGGALTATALMIFLGCPRNEPALPVVEESEQQEDGPLLSAINVADPQAATQMLSGFHTLEQRAWRWTEKSFSVVLQPPAPVEGHQTALEVRLTVPGVVIERLGPVTLTASIDGQEIGSETYDAAGDGLLFSKPVPAELLGQEPVEARMTLDKAIPPSDQDGRELGVVVSAVALR